MPRVTAYISLDDKLGIIYEAYQKPPPNHVTWYPELTTDQIEAIKNSRREKVQEILSLYLKRPI